MPQRPADTGPAIPADARRVVPGHRPVCELSPIAERFLRELARWGYLTLHQAMARTDRSLRSVHVARRELQERGLCVALRLANHMTGPYSAYALTDAGRQAARRLPDTPPQPPADLDHVDRILAIADLALQLRRRGEGDWLAWAEYRRQHPAFRAAVPRPRLPPSGVLRADDGTCTPVWVIVYALYPTALREGVRTLFRRRELQPARLYVLPTLLPWVESLGLITDDIRPWSPPHLQARTPLQPGWTRPFGAERASAPAPGGAAPRVRPLGPRQLATLTWLDRFGHATVDQAAREAGVAPASMSDVLCTLESQGMTQRHQGQRRGCRSGQRQADVWSASAAGLAATSSPREAMRAQPLHRAHTLALVDLADEMESRTGGRWETERELSPQSQTTFGRNARRDAPPPDGRLTLPDGRRVLIQLQLSIGKAPDQCTYARRQRLQGLGDEVWFVCTPEVAPRYRREIRPWEADQIKVVEWTPPDRSGGLREPNPSADAHRRARAARRAQAASEHSEVDPAPQ